MTGQTSTLRTTPHLALAGNPNCGKTALFNALTGSRQKVANYAGVTVERKFGPLTTPAGRSTLVVDLPGTYSLRARSPDEAVTRDVILGRRADEDPPDLLICVADACNLRLNLRLVLELKALGQPMLLVLNMMDAARARGLDIDLDALAVELGIPVVASVAIRKGGTAALLAEIDRSLSGLDEERLLLARSQLPDWREPSAAELRDDHRRIEAILSRVVRTPPHPHAPTRRLDKILLHPLTGLPLLFALLFLMFQAVFSWARLPMELISDGLAALTSLTTAALPEGWLRSLLTDGVIAGVGSVVTFLPQILVLFLFIQVLEDSGYMARAAFLLDKLMGGVGLHGRAFIPLLSSFACAVPGIMATRTISNRADRIITVMIAPFMTCSARLPVYALLIAAFIPDRPVAGVPGLHLPGLVMFALYASGISAGLLLAFILKRMVLRGASEPLLMELPAYRLPRWRNVALALYERASAFLLRAGTTIFCLSVAMWVLSSFPLPPEGAAEPALHYSVAGRIGHWLEPLLAPIGFTWQIAVALVPGMAAREVVVSVLGTLYALSDSGETLRSSLAQTLAQSWSLPTALSLLAWYVFAPQCLATLGVVRRELQSRMWPLVMFVLMLALAYGAAFVTFRLATALSAG